MTMSYIRYCDTCGSKISLRKMGHGKFVAFDAGTDTPHKHNRKKSTWGGDDDDLLQEYFEEGKSIDEICKLLKHNEQFILNRIDKLGLNKKEKENLNKKKQYPKGNYKICSICSGSGEIEKNSENFNTKIICETCNGSGYQGLEDEIILDGKVEDLKRENIDNDKGDDTIIENEVKSESLGEFNKKTTNYSILIFIAIFFIIPILFLS